MAHRKTSESFDWRIWSSRRMRFFTRSAQRARKNHTGMQSRSLSGGIAPNRVFHSTEQSSFAIGSFSNRRTWRPPPSMYA
jgi:hypothetical protein